MRTRLDDHLCPFDSRSIGHAIDQGADLAHRQGRLVIEVIVDGSTWSPQQIGSPQCRDGVADEVQLVSADLGALVAETLEDASTALATADAHQRQAAECLQTGARFEAMEQLGSAIGLWLSVQEAVTSSASALGVDLDTLTFEEHADSVQTRVRDLEQNLGALRGALQNDDSVGLADTLMYDLPQVVADWQEVLLALRTRAEAASRGDCTPHQED